MTKEEIIDFLKENLTIEIDETIAQYGFPQTFSIKLMLCNEEISSTYNIDFPNTEDKSYI